MYNVPKSLHVESAKSKYIKFQIYKPGQVTSSKVNIYLVAKKEYEILFFFFFMEWEANEQTYRLIVSDYHWTFAVLSLVERFFF